MFTGLVEETGVVTEIKPGPGSILLTLRASLIARGLKIGDSVALNGCCLTVAHLHGSKGRAREVKFDLLRETWNLTNFRFLKKGALINLERSLQVGARLGGHFVTGHVDGVGRITSSKLTGKDHVLDIQAPPEVMKYVVHKGSVAVDGISLTVAGVRKGGFRVWIIPHTWKVTALRERKVGSALNLEADLIGKYVHQFLNSSSA